MSCSFFVFFVQTTIETITFPSQCHGSVAHCLIICFSSILIVDHSSYHRLYFIPPPIIPRQSIGTVESLNIYIVRSGWNIMKKKVEQIT